MKQDYFDNPNSTDNHDIAVDFFRQAIGSSLVNNQSFVKVDGGSSSIKSIQNENWVEEPESYDDIDIVALADAIESLFMIAENEDFEDSAESYFSIGLENLIQTFGNIALTIISSFIFSEETSTKVVSEALCKLGQIDHGPTHRNRLRVLEKSLQADSPYIRDGAGLGISFLDDPAAVPQLTEAIKRETNPELKKDLELVLKQLEIFR